MNEFQKEIIETIKTLNTKDFWDYAAIIAPLLLSVIAIVISIYTIRKQTKTELFEKRYDCIYVLGFLVEGAKHVIHNNVSAKDYWTIGMNHFKSISSLTNSGKDDSEVLNFYYNLTFRIIKSNCLFPEKTIKNINVFAEAFLNYITKLFSNKDTKNDEKLLKEAIDLFEKEKTLTTLNKYLKIW